MMTDEVRKLQKGDRVRVLFDFDDLKSKQIHIGTVVVPNDYIPTISYDTIFDEEYYPFWEYSPAHLYCWNTQYKHILGLAKTPKGNDYVQNK